MGGYEGLKPNTECSMPRTESGGHFWPVRTFIGWHPYPQRQQAVAKCLRCFVSCVLPQRKGELQTAVYGIVLDAHAAEPLLPFSD
jgi:hypothetical protein